MNRPDNRADGRDGTNEEAERFASPPGCEEIHALLFDHLTGELELEQSARVRGHLLTCENCRKAAAEIQETLSVLEEAARDPDSIPTHLSEDRRERVFWTFTHPMLDWMQRHHVLVSVCVAIVALVIFLAVMKTRELWGEGGEVTGGATVNIQPSGLGVDSMPTNTGSGPM